jgi:hypothetical protein
MTQAQIQALRMIADAIVEAVRAAGTTGAPGGVIYAALMAHGCTYNQFTSLMSGMVKANLLRREGDLYFLPA